MADKKPTQPPAFPEAPVLPAEGWHVLHLYFRIDPAWLRWLDSDFAAEVCRSFEQTVESIRALPDVQLVVFSVVGAEADFGCMLVAPDLHVADRAAKQFGGALGPGALIPVFDWLSVTERSEYTTTAAEYAASLEAEENLKPGTPEHTEKVEAFRQRMEKYLHHRLYPTLPDWPMVCFYPMSKRRLEQDNWYALPFDRRKELMQGHARVGRTYSGRIIQLITGSTGLDDGEWGVTLFARSTSDIKSIVYEMRFDEVSARYAEFGRFFIGLQMPPSALMERLGLNP